MRKPVVITLLMLSALQPATAQHRQEFDFFQKEAGGRSTLYRGRQEIKYPIRYNGTYYLASPAFQTGSVMYNGRLYENVLLNIDACDQKLLTRHEDGVMEYALDGKAVPWAVIGGQKYVNLHDFSDLPNAFEGYYSVVRDGDSPIYLKVDKLCRTSTSNMNGETGIGYDDPSYNPDVLTYFAIQKKYYIVKDGKLKKVRPGKVRKMLNEK